MGTKSVNSGQANVTIDTLTVGAISGGSAGIFIGQVFVPTGSSITVSDSRMLSTGGALIIPVDAGANLLARSKTCYADTYANGSFIFHVSATGAGAPAGTEVFNYLFINNDLP